MIGNKKCSNECEFESWVLSAYFEMEEVIRSCVLFEKFLDSIRVIDIVIVIYFTFEPDSPKKYYVYNKMLKMKIIFRQN